MIGGALLLCALAISVMGKERANLEVVLYDAVANGEYVTKTYQLTGQFTAAGTTISAEGRIIQLHPLGLCNNNDYDEVYDFGWVGVVKLEERGPGSCLSVLGKAKRAIQRGATAVVFDVTDSKTAGATLHHAPDTLSRPVITIGGLDALKLMRIVHEQKEARIRIFYSQEQTQSGNVISRKEYFDMGIFVAVFVVFCIICILVILKLKWRQRSRQISVSNLAKRAISKLETRKYQPASSKHHIHTSNSDTSVHSSISESCAICLEGYREGQILRVMPCGHEFHRGCVDPWLLMNGTCPLCKINITAQEANQDSAREMENREDVDLLPSSRYSLLQAAPAGSHRGSYLSIPYSHQEYSPMHVLPSHGHLLQACPSCEGTAGSSPSSRNSFPQDKHQSACSSASEHVCSGADCAHTHGFPHHPHPVFIPKPHSRPASRFSGNGTHPLVCSSHSCQDHHGCACVLHSGPVYPGRAAQVFLPVCDSDGEHPGSVRASSILAVRGSSSSDPNPSDTSVECDCYKQSSGSTLIDSNKSTCGSSEVKDGSDISSCDSYVYRGKSPTSSGDEHLYRSSSPSLPPVRLRPACTLNRGSSDTDHLEDAPENLDRSSTSSSSSSQSSEDYAAAVPFRERKSSQAVCQLCHGSHPLASVVQKDSDQVWVKRSSSTMETSHILARNQSVPSQMLLSSEGTSTSCAKYKPVISLPKSQTFSSSREVRTGIRLGMSSLATSNQGEFSSRVVRDSGAISCRTASVTHRPTANKRYSLVECRGTYTSVRSRSYHSSGYWSGYERAQVQRLFPAAVRGPGLARMLNPQPLQGILCQVCGCSQGVSPPRRSMVLFTEPQGAFITIPLGEQEQYNPVNGV